MRGYGYAIVGKKKKTANRKLPRTLAHPLKRKRDSFGQVLFLFQITLKTKNCQEEPKRPKMIVAWGGGEVKKRVTSADRLVKKGLCRYKAA